MFSAVAFSFYFSWNLIEQKRANLSRDLSRDFNRSELLKLRAPQKRAPWLNIMSGDVQPFLVFLIATYEKLSF